MLYPLSYERRCDAETPAGPAFLDRATPSSIGVGAGCDPSSTNAAGGSITVTEVADVY
jgi:hypothetical protein